MCGIRSLSLKLVVFAFLIFGLVSPSVWAYTECSVAPTRVHSGDSGNFYIFFSNGGLAIIRKADPDYSATITVVMFAIATDRPLIVRYEADGVPCNATFQELEGLAMSK